MGAKKKPLLGKEKPCGDCPLQQEESCVVEKRAPSVSDLVNGIKIQAVHATSDEFDKLYADKINSGVYFSEDTDPFPFLFEEKDGKFIMVKDESGENFIPGECPLIDSDPSAYERMFRIMKRVQLYVSKYIPEMPKMPEMKMPKISGTESKKKQQPSLPIAPK